MYRGEHFDRGRKLMKSDVGDASTSAITAFFGMTLFYGPAELENADKTGSRQLSNYVSLRLFHHIQRRLQKSLSFVRQLVLLGRIVGNPTRVKIRTPLFEYMLRYFGLKVIRYQLENCK